MFKERFTSTKPRSDEDPVNTPHDCPFFPTYRALSKHSIFCYVFINGQWQGAQNISSYLSEMIYMKHNPVQCKMQSYPDSGG